MHLIRALYLGTVNNGLVRYLNDKEQSGAEMSAIQMVIGIVKNIGAKHCLLFRLSFKYWMFQITFLAAIWPYRTFYDGHTTGCLLPLLLLPL